MALDTMQDLFVDELRDIYNAETQLLKALPKMAKAATTPTLKEAFEHHLEETKGQVQRLEQIFEELGTSPKGKKCKGMEGLIAEGSEMMGETGADAVIDAGLISAAQRVEHYEIAAYGCVINYAGLLGQTEAVALLEQSLEQEKAADEKLTQLAEEEINTQAMTAGEP